jgi:hypothetical protein
MGQASTAPDLAISHPFGFAPIWVDAHSPFRRFEVTAAKENCA